MADSDDPGFLSKPALRQQQEQATQTMDAIGRVTGRLAHDYNNLLMIIGASLDLLSERLDGDEKNDRLFAAARRGVERGAKLNQQLSDFSQSQDLHADVVRVNDFLQSMHDVLIQAVGPGVSVHIAPAPSAWSCMADPQPLKKALIKLALNASDAMPQGGALSISASLGHADREMAAAMGAGTGDYVVFSVTDTGTGIAPDLIAHVFEPFYTTKEPRKETGLSLSQVYGFARQSHGFVTIDSHPEHGTTACLYLPRAEPR